MESLTGIVRRCFETVACSLDLSTLEGVTIARDYQGALDSLDLGYRPGSTPTATNDDAVGVGRTLSVLRKGIVKNHIVLDGQVLDWLVSGDEASIRLASHLILHESAHVQVAAAYEAKFPGRTIGASWPNILDAWRWQVIHACWDEYAVCLMVSGRIHDPLPDYDNILASRLEQVDEKVASILATFDGTDVDSFTGSLFGAYGNVLKSAAYVLGAMTATGRVVSDLQRSGHLIEEGWFGPYFDGLSNACKALWDGFPDMTDEDPFEAIGDLVEQIVQDRAVRIQRGPERCRYQVSRLC